MIGGWGHSRCHLLAGLRKPPVCELCPVMGGAMKATICGKWCHMICALWCPDPIGLNGGLLEGMGEVNSKFHVCA